MTKNEFNALLSNENPEQYVTFEGLTNNGYLEILENINSIQNFSKIQLELEPTGIWLSEVWFDKIKIEKSTCADSIIISTSNGLFEVADINLVAIFDGYIRIDYRGLTMIID